MDEPVCSRCAMLEAEVADLRRLVAELTERLNRDSSNSSKPPSSDEPRGKPAPPRRPSGRKRGGQPGHARAVRPLVPPDKVAEAFDHRPDACRGCGHALADDDPEPLRHQVAEIPPVEPRVVEHRLHRLACPRCGRATRAALPPGVPAGRFGHRLAAVLALLAGGYRVGKRGVRRLARDLFGLDVALGTVARLERRTAAALAPTVAELESHVRGGPANVDETGWREGRRRAWLWVVVAPRATVFRVARQRTAAVAQGLLGAAYPHVATCDRFRGYLWIGRVQLCWAHLRRDFQAMVDRGGAAEAIGAELLFLSDVLFERWRRVRDGTLARRSFHAGPAATLRADVRAALAAGAACGCAKTEATCRDLLGEERHLWSFARTDGVEPTNNAAERALRHAVLWRKASGGTDGAAGSRFVERILSVAATCRQQGRDVLATLAACLAAHHAGTPPVSLLPSNATATAA
jgi:transposase